jgi:hypothetical protein
MNTPLIVAAATDNTTEEMKIKVLKLLPFLVVMGTLTE